MTFFVVLYSYITTRKPIASYRLHAGGYTYGFKKASGVLEKWKEDLHSLSYSEDKDKYDPDTIYLVAVIKPIKGCLLKIKTSFIDIIISILTKWQFGKPLKQIGLFYDGVVYSFSKSEIPQPQKDKIIEFMKTLDRDDSHLFFVINDEKNIEVANAIEESE